MPAVDTSWIGNARYRSYERLTRVRAGKAAASAGVLAAVGIALADHRVAAAVTFAVGAAIVAALDARLEIGRLRRGLAGARIGALPPGERPLEELAREWRSLPLAVLVQVGALAAVAAALQLLAESFGHWLSVGGAIAAGVALGQSVVLRWLRRRRRGDGTELHIREREDAQADEPPALLLVPRGG